MTGDTRPASRPHTAAGLLLLSLGLAQLTYRRSFDHTNDVSNDARRILTISTAAILTITIACAAMCFTVVVRHSHDVQQAALGSELNNQAELIAAELATQRQEAESHRRSQSLDDILAPGCEPSTGTGTPRCNDGPSVACRLSRGLAALELIDSSGRTLLTWGTPAAALDDDRDIGSGDSHRDRQRSARPDRAAVAARRARRGDSRCECSSRCPD